MSYFEGCTSKEQCKDRYRELAMQHHPDKGGDVETMKQVNIQYKKIIHSGLFSKSSNIDTGRVYTHGQKEKPRAPWEGGTSDYVEPGPWDSAHYAMVMPMVTKAAINIIGLYFNIDPIDARQYVKARNEQQLVEWASEIAEKCKDKDHQLCANVARYAQYIKCLMLE